jgi:hypothetical protein
MLMEIIVEGAIAFLGWGGISHFGIERSIALLGIERDIEKYLNYPIANQDLFQQTTSTICGMVEIEQVELSRKKRGNVSAIANK